jgi:hypothetical protein
MGGGLMQLVAYGAQDVYLTGNPQITFFKVVYRRHTNFSKECIEQTFSGAVGVNKRVTATLARNGDLVQEVYVKVELSTTSAVDGQLENKTLNCDLTNLLKSAEVEIGGQKIDKQYYQWMDIYNTLFETNHDYRNAMCVGKVLPAGEYATNDAANVKSTVYLPLRFWFNRNPGLALPLIALQYHEVKVNIELAELPASGSADVTHTLDEATLLVNYVYLDTDERRRFAQVSHEYLIEQVQHTGAETVENGKITLNFNHPVKCLAWSSGVMCKTAKLQLNGHDRAAVQKGEYYQLVQPYECGLGHSLTMNASTRKWTGAPGDAWVYLYSFSLKPAEHQPSGTCNFSRIDNAVLNMTHASETEVSLHAVNYNVLRVMSGMGGLAYSN